MTKIYTYTFTTYRRLEDGGLTTDEHILKLRVTDRMEERATWKRGYACTRFNELLREKYGFKKDVVQAWMLKEVK